jgi:hypothetical protein
MKRVRRVTGEAKERLKRDPVQVFDGVADYVELPYSERVTGIGDFKFVPVPRPSMEEAAMAELWQNPVTAAKDDAPVEAEPAAQSSDTATGATPKAGYGLDPSEIGDGNLGAAESPEGSVIEHETDTNGDGPLPARGKKVLLIETNEDTVNDAFRAEAERASRLVGEIQFQRPDAFSGKPGSAPSSGARCPVASNLPSIRRPPMRSTC